MGTGAVIIGATSLAQLEANWAAACLRLPDAVLRKVDEIHVRMRNPNLHDWASETDPAYLFKASRLRYRPP